MNRIAMICWILLLSGCSAGSKSAASATQPPANKSIGSVRIASGPPMGTTMGTPSGGDRDSSDRVPSNQDATAPAPVRVTPLSRPSTGIFKEELAPPPPGMSAPAAAAPPRTAALAPVASPPPSTTTVPVSHDRMASGDKLDDKEGNIWLARNSSTPRRWQWPAEGSIISHFGTFGAKRNNGIEIKLPPGTTVAAAAAGVVAYADDKLPGYGKMVIVSHGGAYVTTYAHNQSLTVRRGQKVAAGQKVAVSGTSLYFEFRRHKVPDNPLKYLPKL
ncbi:MAG: peptidoglycan DD-metalloendopeptidase family protein [Magnetococcales bacterium]|nr:peptidoglycan DD-metalloendopeptidase family protein [Magnetococcales bacterium]